MDKAPSSQTIVEKQTPAHPLITKRQYLHSTECPDLENVQLSFIARGGQNYTRVDEFCIGPEYSSHVFKAADFLDSCEQVESSPYIVQNQYLLEPELLSLIAEFERAQHTTIQSNAEAYTSLRGGLDEQNTTEEIQFQLNENTVCVANISQKEQYTHVNDSNNAYNTGVIQQSQTLLNHHVIYTVEVTDSFHTITYIKNIEFTIENDYMMYKDSIYCRSKGSHISLTDSKYQFGVSHLDENESNICILPK